MNCACGKPMGPKALQCASCEKRYLDGLVRASLVSSRDEARVALANARAEVPVVRLASAAPASAPPADASDERDPFVRFLSRTAGRG